MKTKKRGTRRETESRSALKTKGRGVRVVTEDGNASKTKKRASRVLKPKISVPSNSNGEATSVVKPKDDLPSQSSAEKPNLPMKPTPDLASLCSELRDLQRHRVIYIKSRIMIANRLQALVAGSTGYRSGLEKKERLALFIEAGNLIKRISAGEEDSDLKPLITAHQVGVEAFNDRRDTIEKEMVRLAKQLPVADWVEQSEQKGFGLKSLGIVIGETGDLFNYANPAKVWRRLGCAPWTFDGKTRMGATWRCGKEGKLPASEWEEYGYSPRRRSISYLIGEGIVKQNGDGSYRKRYDDTKQLASENHPEWLKCSKCKGTGKTAKGGKCANCRGTGEVWMRCHLHGMLLATKLLLKNLWIEWTQ